MTQAHTSQSDSGLTQAGERSPADAVERGAVDAIVSASHGDPFAVLGPHEVSPGVWDIRVMQPNAEQIDLLDFYEDRLIGQFEQVHRASFFVARIHSDVRPGYRLKIRDGGGERVINDPYLFGSSLSHDDIAAIAHSNDTAFYFIFGAHPITLGGVWGTRFVVWAPSAMSVSVVGDFNAWDGRCHPMRGLIEVGVWELFIPGIAQGTKYKFEIKGQGGQTLPLKADPVAFAAQHPPETASVIHGLPKIEWHDGDWIANRAVGGDDRKKPISIYECHVGSWQRVPEEGNRFLTYKEMGERLVPYVRDMGFTHIELLPITEFPYDGSWGYQPVSLFAPTSRFGTPEDFVAFVEAAHAAGIGLILDWVPAHFPIDAHGLAKFDGTHLYEHADPRQGFHQDWGTYIYNVGRKEVSAFLIANARFWLDYYHLDGLRVDAVASMLYLDYSRKSNEWVPNQYGGNENLEAIAFLRRMNEVAYQAAPGVITVAEESTAWPGVSQPTYNGGLGFGFKWNMGWMHDTLHYIGNDPIHRRHHHSELTFGLLYAFSENFILPISHDEVVHGKGSLLDRMPGDEWQRFANLRAYLGFMWTHPGKKLLFMGCEFAQAKEWNYNQSLDWHLLDQPNHKGVQSLVRDLNATYRATPALYERDCEASGFQWLVGGDADNSVLAFARYGDDASLAVVACNFTPVPRSNYRIGVPRAGFYREILNTDAEVYGGANMGNLGGIEAEAIPSHGEDYSIALTLPPLATIAFARS
ncbi:1,4-alpha-glucan branching protein GlgB [Beijerinckia sp. L45]|uniref:1,4-alpha-glucan branching protein GlgB n=1 Tax=Beijerinckia sp. L45 TaxID=1641855 RepID=UPI00131D5111|nr:1,4-alpha-glucan branching protein GlgB [Beijerinckia sp. L45]